MPYVYNHKQKPIQYNSTVTHAILG